MNREQEEGRGTAGGQQAELQPRRCPAASLTIAAIPVDFRGSPCESFF